MNETRSAWPTAEHLQQAADRLRTLDINLHPHLQDYCVPVANWLDQTANEMAWLAPFREHEGGYHPWRNATRIAHGVLELPAPDTCPTCQTNPRRAAS